MHGTFPESLIFPRIRPTRSKNCFLILNKLEIELERLHSAGVWVLIRADADYPRLYKQRLNDKAPRVLFGAGEKLLLNQSGVAVVGSRNVDEGGKSFTEQIGNIAANNGWIVFSGGAKGVDIISMQNALEGRGCTVGVIATSLLQTLKKPVYKNALSRGDLALISPFGANTGFSVGAAMGRNKLIYTLAEYAVVVASDLEKGGTWAGSIEAIKNNWLPVFVRQTEPEIEGNAGIIQKGGIQLDDPFPVPPRELQAWMEARKQEWLARPKEETFEQKQLF